MAGPARGEIWNADLDPTRGREQAGRRPVLVVSTDRFNDGSAELVVILPITSKAKGIPWHVRLLPAAGTGLRTESFALVEAIRCVSRDRLSKRLGQAAPAAMDEVETRLRILLEL
ncbi:MAG: type II toxin-antitoxin system PemK/MazF family toxin [Pirellulaceae bacterium]